MPVQSVGPVILDVAGAELTQEDIELIGHPLVGGVILFARNYHSPVQIAQLCQSIRSARKGEPLLITVDQEGGRVQRFKDGFILLPSMRDIGVLYRASPEEGLHLAYLCGWVMAAELLAVGVDMSFAPVLDLDKGINAAIGNRAFDSQPGVVTLLATAVMKGMHEAGMAATGKHFPGHGSVDVDSHFALPVDERSLEIISQNDMQTFVELIHHGIDALMPAHIVFSAVDDKPVGFSQRWLHDILRNQLNFTGILFSDDLNMQGAHTAGNYAERAEAALRAGCDMALICNNRPGAIEVLDQLPRQFMLDQKKLSQLRGKFLMDLPGLHASEIWQRQYHSFVKYSEKLYEIYK